MLALSFSFSSPAVRPVWLLDWLTDKEPTTYEQHWRWTKTSIQVLALSLYFNLLMVVLHSLWAGHISLDSKYTQCALVNKGAAAGTRELIAFIESLSAMQKGIILTLSMNFLYEISRHFVSAPTALLLRAKCRQRRGGEASCTCNERQRIWHLTMMGNWR